MLLTAGFRAEWGVCPAGRKTDDRQEWDCLYVLFLFPALAHCGWTSTPWLTRYDTGSVMLDFIVGHLTEILTSYGDSTYGY